MTASSGSGFPSLARARYAQAVLAVIALFTAMDVYIGKLVIEPMKLDLGLDDVQAGMVNVTASAVAYALCAIPAGMLADRLDRVRLLLWAVVLWCGGLAMFALSHTLWLMVAGKGVLGMAQAITYPAALSLFSDLFAPEKRASATASYPIGQALGGAGAVLVGGLGLSALSALAARSPELLLGLAPWRAVSLLFGAVSLVLIPMVSAVREPARMEVGQAQGASLRELVAYRGFLLPLFLGMMFLSGAAGGVYIWMMPALTRLYGQKPGDFAGWLSALTLAASVFGMVLSGRLMQLELKRDGRQAVMIPAAVAALVTGLCSFVAVTPNVLIFAVVMGVALVAVSVAIAIPVIAVNFRIPNELRGLVMGLYVVLVALASGFAAPLVGGVSAALGSGRMLGWAMGLVGLPCGLLAALCFWLAARAPATGALGGSVAPKGAADPAHP